MYKHLSTQHKNTHILQIWEHVLYYCEKEDYNDHLIGNANLQIS